MKRLESQRETKIEGTAIEKFVQSRLVKYLPSEYDMSWNPNQGIDLFLHDGRVLNIEIKGARRWERYKYKGSYSKRSGRFYLKEEDYLHADFFAFVIKPVNESLQWDKDKPMKMRLVDASIVREYLKNKGLYRKYKSVKLPLKVIKEFPTTDPASIFAGNL